MSICKSFGIPPPNVQPLRISLLNISTYAVDIVVFYVHYPPIITTYGDALPTNVVQTRKNPTLLQYKPV